MRWTLRYQVLLPFSLVMASALLGVSVLNAYLSAQRMRQTMAAKLDEIAGTLCSGRFPLTESVLRQAGRLSGAEFILCDAKGTTLVATLPVTESPPPTAPADEVSLGREYSVGGQDYFHRSWTVPQTGLESGVLHILFPTKKWQENRAQAIAPPLFVGGAALVIVGLVSITLARRVTQPIGDLRSQVAQLARGDYLQLALPPRDDELRDLAASVNSLAVQLEQLRQVIRRTERLALLGQLSGGLAHHLRNSLTGARMAIQLHGRQCQADQQSLSVALRQLSLTEEQLQRLLTLGQPQILDRKALNLQATLAEVAEWVGPTCAHRQIGFELEAPQPLEIVADHHQLRHLLLNLTLNAIDAAGPGGWVRIAVAPPQDQDQVCIRVWDSGAGPQPEIVASLFEPFATSKPEGVGLGLAIARQIAEQHGGSLGWFRDQATCFEVQLPHPRRNGER